MLIKLAGEGGVADNFTEGDEFPEERAGGARETEVRAGGAQNFYLEAEEIADKIAGRAVHEAAGEVEVVAGGSSIRLLIRV